MLWSTLALDVEAVLTMRRAVRDVREASVGEILRSFAGDVRPRGARTADEILRAHRKAVHGRFVPRPTTCLPRALGLARLLRRHGHAAALVLGVQPGEVPTTGLEGGHAWVEIDGQPFGEPEGKTEKYVEFLRAPEPEGGNSA